MVDIGHDRGALKRRGHDVLRWWVSGFLVLASFAGVALALNHWLAAPDARVEVGRAEFQRFCAGCHGADARGKGPLAAGLGKPPKDLTTIALRHGATFDIEDITRFIDGRAQVAAHGPRDMPVWAEIWQDDSEDARRARMDALVVWLWSVQR